MPPPHPIGCDVTSQALGDRRRPDHQRSQPESGRQTTTARPSGEGRSTGSRLPAPPCVPFTRLSDMVARWRGQLPGVAHGQGYSRMMIDAALQLGAELTADAPAPRLLHGDLHPGNILAARREPWLAIDPKPLSGEWAFAVAPVLWNRWDEATRAHNLRAHLRLRLGLVCEAAGIDEDRAMAWSFVRLVTNALWEAAEPQPGRTELSRWIAAAKTMTD